MQFKIKDDSYSRFLINNYDYESENGGKVKTKFRAYFNPMFKVVGNPIKIAQDSVTKREQSDITGSIDGYKFGTDGGSRCQCSFKPQPKENCCLYCAIYSQQLKIFGIGDGVDTTREVANHPGACPTRLYTLR